MKVIASVQGSNRRACTHREATRVMESQGQACFQGSPTFWVFFWRRVLFYMPEPLQFERTAPLRVRRVSHGIQLGRLLDIDRARVCVESIK